MKNLIRYVWIILLLLLVPAVSCAEKSLPEGELPHHDLRISLFPERGRITAEDTITLPSGSASEIHFFLHPGLDPQSLTDGVRITRASEGSPGAESFTVHMPEGTKTFSIQYEGVISHALEPVGMEQARGFSDSRGIISTEGIYLTSNSLWYPDLGEGLLTFALEIRLPEGWDAVSQGERTTHQRTEEGTRVKWESRDPQDGLVIAAAPFQEYDDACGNVRCMVFLREEDAELARKYLDAASRYIEMYDGLIGPYPYKKFALVENFWETGFGMPSFTLLGPQVIRLPFIINSSFPHEILHNWWGNGVFPDYATGNWSEGLTAYLSDHLIKEQQDGGPEYRLTTLQKYTDYVSEGRDFPLIDFRSRHSPSSEAVGYGKALMFFHMLRLELGDRVFIRALQEFYREFLFRFASYRDLRKSFEKVSGKDLNADFDQWVVTSGAPEIQIEHVGQRKRDSGYHVSGTLRQSQSGKAYRLLVPVAVTMEEKDRAFQTIVVMDSKLQDFEFDLQARPLRIDIDSEYDLFRRLDRREVPPAISQALGAKKMLVVLPSSARKDLIDAYGKLAEMLGESGPVEVEIKSDVDVKDLPRDRSIAILGWENRFFPEIASSMEQYNAFAGREKVRIDSSDLPVPDHSFVLTAKNGTERETAVLFIATDMPEAVPALGRKLPHYHKYSYLVFRGAEAENIMKGRWPVVDSPLTFFFKDGSGAVRKTAMAKLKEREPLVRSSRDQSAGRMMETVRFLSDTGLEGRGLGSRGLDSAAEYIAMRFRDAGLLPAGDSGDTFFQTWVEEAGDPAQKTTLRNVVGVIPGTNPELAKQSVVIGAHYDHIGFGWPDVRGENRGKFHPGADDNASGIAVLVELANALGRSFRPERTIVFAAFTGEEAGKRGSAHYVASEKRYPVDACFAMINLDTVGRLNGKKLLALDSSSAREWGHILRGACYLAGIDVDMVQEELDSSDQRSFIAKGIPGVQIFSGANVDYHRPSDTADKIDPDGLVKVAEVVKEMVAYLSSRREPLTAGIPAKGGKASSGSERKVSLGTVPDFSYKGEGVRLSGVVPGSPAEISGLREGDIMIRMDTSSLTNLRDLSEVLKSLNPGSRVEILFLRDGREMKTETILVPK
jgi:aminopeptidase N